MAFSLSLFCEKELSPLLSHQHHYHCKPFLFFARLERRTRVRLPFREKPFHSSSTSWRGKRTFLARGIRPLPLLLLLQTVEKACAAAGPVKKVKKSFPPTAFRWALNRQLTRVRPLASNHDVLIFPYLLLHFLRGLHYFEPRGGKN